MPPAATDDGPVIGGSRAIGSAPPSPPPPDVKGPGVGNLSGLILLLAVFGGIAAKIAQKALKTHATSSAMHKAQKKAREMAAELRNAAQQEKNAPKKPKSKRPTVGKHSKEEAAPLVDADEEGESEDEEEEEEEEARVPVNTPSPPANEPGAKKKDKRKKEKKSPKPSKKAAAAAAAAAADEADDNDDAVSALCFGAPASRSAAVEVDAASAVTLDFDEEGGLMYGDDDDDITPDDSVSNIGWNRQPPPRKPSARRATAASALPGIVEQNSAELVGEEDEEQASSPTHSDGFRTLGDLDAGELRRPVGNKDDGFSVVHEKHIAMRNEIQVNLQSGGARKGVPPRSAGARKLTEPEGVLLDDDDGASDVTFNFDAGPKAGRARPPAPPADDDAGSDVGSAVTFNFGFQQQPAPPPSRRAPAKLPPPPREPVAATKQRSKVKQCSSPKASPGKRTAAPKPPATKPVPDDDEDDEDDEDEEDEEGGSDDDRFTSVALSTRPRDPYLGMRGKTAAERSAEARSALSKARAGGRAARTDAARAYLE